MKKPLFWMGIALATLGAVLFLMLVVPRLPNTAEMTALPNGVRAGIPTLWSVTLSALTLAGGAALIGIGLGRWKHPRPSETDGSPEV